MHFREKVKCWFDKNKKYVLIGGSIAFIVVGTGKSCVLCKDKKISFADWLKNAPQEELEKAYEKLRLDFCKTGVKAYPMEQISRELGERGAAERFAKHPPNLDPNFRWTDAARWDKN